MPTPLDENYELRFLWRDPIDGTPVQCRAKLIVGKGSLRTNRYLHLPSERPPPYPYKMSDFELLEQTRPWSEFAQEGFEIYQPQGAVHRM